MEMKVIELSHTDEKMGKAPQVLAIGFFDGIHLGHMKLLSHAKKVADKQDVLFSVLTFYPHPDVVIKGHKNRKYLMPLPQKISKMESIGVEQLFIMNFDRAFASLPPAEFIRKYIVESNTRHVVVGFDFTFGYKAQGNTDFLLHESEKHGFGLSVIPKKTYLGEKISSTRIRNLVKNGKVESIHNYLGGNYEISGRILQNELAKKVIFKPSSQALLPAPGTYNVRIKQNNRVIQGKYYQYADTIERNILMVNENAVTYGAPCKIAFINKEKNVKSLSV